MKINNELNLEINKNDWNKDIEGWFNPYFLIPNVSLDVWANGIIVTEDNYKLIEGGYLQWKNTAVKSIKVLIQLDDNDIKLVSVQEHNKLIKKMDNRTKLFVATITIIPSIIAFFLSSFSSKTPQAPLQTTIPCPTQDTVLLTSCKNACQVINKRILVLEGQKQQSKTPNSHLVYDGHIEELITIKKAIKCD